MHLQNFENFGNECAKIKNQFLIFRKSLCKIAGNPWKSILKSINQNAFFSRVMTFKKYSIKTHYKVNKLVRIIKFSHFKNLSDNLNMNKTTKVFF
jgi:hypothetical protein